MKSAHPLDATSLLCFVAAAETGNFRTAARRVSLSPPAFSDRMKRLEDDVGSVLFQRTTRTMSMTAAGERLLPVAKRALHELARCREAITDEQIPFSLTIGTRFELGLSFVLPALDALEKETPHRTVHLRFGDSDELLEKTIRGEIDATISSVRMTRAGFRYATIHDEDYAFVGAAKLLGTRPIKAANDAAAHTLIDAHPDLPLFRYFKDASPKSEQWIFHRESFLGTIGAIHQRIRDGRGVGVLPRYLINDDVKRGRLQVLFPKRTLVTDTFRLIFRKGHARESDLHAIAASLRSRPLT